MIIFIHEDRAYLSWVVHHRDGFVVDWLRQPTRKHPVLHRAVCTEIRRSSSKNTHWTTGRHLKACSQDLEELNAWIKDEGCHSPEICTECQPMQQATPTADDRRLTTLSRELLEYALEVAVMCLDERIEEYSVTLSDLAQQSQKTPAQLSSAVARLFEAEFLTTASSNIVTKLRQHAVIYPTERALRTLPDFASMDSAQIDRELSKLYRPEP